jgi:hypothetical protein
MNRNRHTAEQMICKLLAGRRPAAADPAQAEVGQACGRLCEAPQRRMPQPVVGDGFPVRGHRRWPEAQVRDHGRGVQPPVPGDPGGTALQGQGCGDGAGGTHQPLPSASHPPHLPTLGALPRVGLLVIAESQWRALHPPVPARSMEPCPGVVLG